MIDLADGDLNENSYLEFSGYLNFDTTTDGIIYQNVKKAEIEAIRAGNPAYDVFYEVDDPTDVLADRKENEYFYQGTFNISWCSHNIVHYSLEALPNIFFQNLPIWQPLKDSSLRP